MQYLLPRGNLHKGVQHLRSGIASKREKKMDDCIVVHIVQITASIVFLDGEMTMSLGVFLDHTKYRMKTRKDRGVDNLGWPQDDATLRRILLSIHARG
jgi:hypothetical protein